MFTTPTVKLVHHSAYRNPDAEPRPVKFAESSTEDRRPASGLATLSAAPAPAPANRIAA